MRLKGKLISLSLTISAYTFFNSINKCDALPKIRSCSSVIQSGKLTVSEEHLNINLKQRRLTVNSGV